MYLFLLCEDSPGFDRRFSNKIYHFQKALLLLSPSLCPQELKPYCRKFILIQVIPQAMALFQIFYKPHAPAGKMLCWFKSSVGSRARKINRRFPRRKSVSKGLNHIWQANLVDMQAIQKENAGRRYLLMVIDVFSRRASAKAIKSKQPHHVIEAFSLILCEARAHPNFYTWTGGGNLPIDNLGISWKRNLSFFTTHLTLKLNVLQSKGGTAH